MRRSGLIAALLLGVPPVLPGQTQHWSRPAYFGSTSVQLLIFGDSARGVQLWTTFRAAGAFSRAATFLPADVLTWVASAESLLVAAPLGDPDRWVHPSLLPAANGDALLLGRKPNGKYWERRADLLYLRHTAVGDSAILDVRFELWDAKDFLDSMEAKAIAARGYAPRRDTAAVSLAVNASPPAVVSMCPLRYPEDLRLQGIQGSVTLAATVDTNGRVDPKTIEPLYANDPGFLEPARAALECARFRPARRDGVAVPIDIVIPVNFSLTRR